MKSYICTLLFLISISLSLGIKSLAADPSPAALIEDLVRIEESRFVIDKDLHCQLRLPLSLGGGTPFNEFGMHARFSAPSSGLISRDMFVALSMRIFTEYRARMAADIPGLTNEQTLKAMECRETRKSTPKKEYLFQVSMSPDGVESTIINERLGTKHVTKEPWSEVIRRE